MVYCYGIVNRPVEVETAGELIKVYPLAYLFKPWAEFWNAIQWGDKNLSEGTKRQVKTHDRVMSKYHKMKTSGNAAAYVAVADRKGKIQPGTAVFRVINPVFCGIWWDDHDPGTPVGIYAPAAFRGEKPVLARVYIPPRDKFYYCLENNEWVPYLTRVDFDGTQIRETKVPFQEIYPGSRPLRVPPPVPH